MNIAVLNNCVPFVSGGAEYLADALVTQLRAHGHQAALYRIPFRWSPPDRIVEGMLACRLMRLWNVDRAIALKFPAYYVPHDNKVLWLLHQFRQAYELWGTPFQDLPDTDEGRQIRRAIIQSDNTFLPEARAIYTNSHVTRDRLKRFNGLDSEVLYPPLLHPERYACREYGDYLFYPSRITNGKRQHLVVDALRHTRTPVRLVVAGVPESPDTVRQLQATIESGGLGGRVTLMPRFISEEEKLQLFAGALACAYTPVDEDSYGYVTLEAYQSLKPVISCRDSGGVTTVVAHGETGYLLDPDPEQIARAMDALYLDKARARAMGEAGRRHIEAMGISWDRVIEKLTA
jgi:glycosyltransferase involved in cell wall biosynthesis